MLHPKVEFGGTLDDRILPGSDPLQAIGERRGPQTESRKLGRNQVGGPRQNDISPKLTDE